MSTHALDGKHGAAADSKGADIIDAVYRKVSWRLIPFLMLCYAIAFLDRINIGYAQLQMKQTLTFSDATYGFGAGIFFVGYFLFEVPSNLLLAKIGARKTLLRIMFIWGIVAAAMSFVQTPMQFYIARFLLGVFEAGFFPGIILYFTYWYSSARRGQVIALFMTATAISSVIAGPAVRCDHEICGRLCRPARLAVAVHRRRPARDGPRIAAYLYLPDKPEDANWLDADEKQTLRHHLDHDEKDVESASHTGLGQMFADPKVYALALAYFLLLGATYTMVFWIPTLIKGWGVTDYFHVGLYAAVPQLFGIFTTVWMGRHSDRHRERRWHYAACVAMAAAGLAIIATSQGNFTVAMAGLTLAGMGWIAATPLFFTTTTEYLSAASAAGGIALISSLGNLGPAAGPSVTGWLTAQTGTPLYSMGLVIAAYVLSGSILLSVVRANKQLATAPA